MQKTRVVHNRYAWRINRTQAALEGTSGVVLLTIEQLAARLAGGFLQPIDSDDLKTAIASAIPQSLGELDTIKKLPGFPRAAATSLPKAWAAGIDLEAESDSTKDPAAKQRLASLVALEREVLAGLPANQLRPKDLVAAAMAHVERSNAIFGPIEIHGRTEMSPVWHPLLIQLSKHTNVTWVAGARQVPKWLADMGITVVSSEAAAPAVEAFSCASPRHEMLEAFRWARRHLANGALPQEIAIVAASPEAWDDHVLALMEDSNLPFHFVHGHSALSTQDGQLAAALAELLLRGFTRTRMVRLVALLRSQTKRFKPLPGNWWRTLPDDAPLLDAARWRETIDALSPADFSDGIDHRQLLDEVIGTLSKGLNAASEIGETLLEKGALTIWRKALVEGPPAALDVTLTGLRVDDGVEPEAAIVWGPASAVASAPRPFAWLVGLTSRTWPRRAAEDSLLPDHIVPWGRLDPLPVHDADRRDFWTIRAMTGCEFVCSRARRDSEGRLNGVSPLYPRDVEELYRAQSREPEHATSTSDRLLARPEEFGQLPHAKSAHQTWIDWHSPRLTGHDGMIRGNHPLLLQALERRQSATSLVKLLRDPIGYLWTYGFGWSEPEETDEPLTLDPLAFGNLLHEILEEAVTQIEATGSMGLGAASVETIGQAIGQAADIVKARWDSTKPVPPPVIWQHKLAESVELALIALSHQEDPLPGQRSWAEIPFGGDRKADSLSEEALSALPWNPQTAVQIPGTAISIGGSIDRLDLAGDRSVARVTDYKSGRLRGRPPQLKGGAELQRCLYAYAVKALVADNPDVEARLLYPRSNAQVLPLQDPEGTLESLTGFLAAAVSSFADGNAIPGPATLDSWYDFAFALPGGAKESYLDEKLPLTAQALSDIEPLWGHP